MTLIRSKLKIYIAYIFYYTGLSHLFFFISLQKNTIRVINYHCTPESEVDNFKKQILFLSRFYRNINLDTLNSFFEGESVDAKPGIIISFDDGLRSNFDFAVNYLEELSFTGWFFVPSNFISHSDIESLYINNIFPLHMYDDNRYIMNGDELRMIYSKGHIIGCHTNTHYRMTKFDNIQKLKFEIYDSKLLLENVIDSEVFIFCWVGGEIQHYTKEAYDYIINSGYKYSFTTNNKLITNNTDRFNIDRTNVETTYSFPLFLFQISGILDFMYFSKREKILKLFAK